MRIFVKFSDGTHSYLGKGIEEGALIMRCFVFFAILFFSLSSLEATDYYVDKNGSKGNDGKSSANSFSTIQQGVGVLKPGDTLTIAPGEYFEAVKCSNLGSIEKKTIIRAEIPGTVLLRGDVLAPSFKKVDGYRFVYAAPFDKTPQALLEVDTLNTIVKRPNIPTLELNPGTFHYDLEKKILYMSSSDMIPPSKHLYRVSVTPKSGLWLVDPKGVVVEGISATGFNTTIRNWHRYSIWGIRLDNPVKCEIRDCVVFLNSGGITMWGGGSDNVIERCVAYGNFSQNVPGGAIRRFGGNNDVIRDCYAYKSKRRGISFYGKGEGDVLLKNNISWGHSLHDFRIKAHGAKGTAIAENCVALGNGMVHEIRDCLVDKNDYRTNGMKPGNITHDTYKETKYREFADPDNLDFRLQSTSQLRGAGVNGKDIGPYPYKPNIFYVRTDGDDKRDGSSSRLAWKTLTRAFSGLKRGDTLYLEPGVYKSVITLSAANIAIRGRGIKPVILHGALTLSKATGIVFKRLNFKVAIKIDNCGAVGFENCRFADFNAEKTDAVKLRHCVFTKTPRFNDCRDLFSSGNIFAKGIDLEKTDPTYSDYNSYVNINALKKSKDKHSLALTPLINDVNGGFAVVKNKNAFAGLGPNGTAIGIYTPYRKEAIRFVGPFLHSVSGTTANFECWTSLAADCEVAWGTTEKCENKKTLKVNGFGSFSLNGLIPGKKYYFKVKSVMPKKNNYNLFIRGIAPKKAELSFTTSAKPPKPATYYVALDGKDSNNGLNRANALRTVSHAASLVNAGDTVLIAGGTYKETVVIRATGAKGNPITFKAISGEKVVMDGAKRMLSESFIGICKKYLNFDGFYFKNYKHEGWGGVFYFDQCSNVRISRCFMDGRGKGNPNLFLYTHDCDNVLVKNCLILNGFYGMYITNSDLTVENTVILRNWIEAIISHGGQDHKVLLKNSIITDDQPFKVGLWLFQIGLSEKFYDENNCYYLRKPDKERRMFLFYADPELKKFPSLHDRRMSLADYKLKVRETSSFMANPWFKATVGMKEDGKMGKYAKEILIDRLMSNMNLDFPDFFATTTEVVKRGIGLQPEAFKDFHFNKKH